MPYVVCPECGLRTYCVREDRCPRCDAALQAGALAAAVASASSAVEAVAPEPEPEADPEPDESRRDGRAARIVAGIGGLAVGAAAVFAVRRR